MKKWAILTSGMFFLMAVQMLRAEEPKSCPEGRAVFGRLTCAGARAGETALDAYFFGATTLEEIRSTFPERAEKFEAHCRKKMTGRALARVYRPIEPRVVVVESCLGKRGYLQPCVKNDDCHENFCNVDRGTCSAVFTVPISAP